VESGAQGAGAAFATVQLLGGAEISQAAADELPAIAITGALAFMSPHDEPRTLLQLPPSPRTSLATDALDGN